MSKQTSQNVIFHQFNNTQNTVRSEMVTVDGKTIIGDNVNNYQVSALNGKLNLENVYAVNFKKDNELYYIKVLNASNQELVKIKIRERYYGPFQFLSHINSELTNYNISFDFTAEGAFKLTKTTAHKLQITPILYKYFRGLDKFTTKIDNLYVIDSVVTTAESDENNRSKFYTWNLVCIESNIGIEKTIISSNTKSDIDKYDILMSLIINSKNEDAVRNLIYSPDVLRKNIITANGFLANAKLLIKVFFENGEYEEVTVDPGSSNLLQLQFNKY